LRDLRATGFIGRVQSPQIEKTLLKSRLPVVALDLSEEQLTSPELMSRVSEIIPNSHKAGRLAAEHFLDRGFRQFAFCGYAKRIWSRHRQEGFCERLAEAGFQCNVYQSRTSKTHLPWDEEQPAVTMWLKSLNKPVGLVACNDLRGRQVLEVCALKGLRVPDEVAVLGVDDDHLLCELANPSLSSVALNGEQAGYQAAELLEGLMAGRIAKPQRIEADALWIVNRRSTDVVAVDDPEVSEALRFIRDNSRQPIGVNDVVNQVTLSRRGLEIRFQRALNRSIHDEIAHVRIERTKKFLVETTMPLWKIAELTGFDSLSYMSRMFHGKVGKTLAQYRRDHSVG
jgi:LacI family transcriptional regulator